MNQRGVTLIEMLIVMALLSGFLLIITTIFTATVATQQESNGYGAIVSDGRFIMARLNYDIRRANTVTTPGTLGSSADSLGLTIGGNTYSYALSGDDLSLTDSTGTDDLNSDGATVSDLTFEQLGNSGGKVTIRYSFTLTTTSSQHGGHDTETFTSTAGER